MLNRREDEDLSLCKSSICFLKMFLAVSGIFWFPNRHCWIGKLTWLILRPLYKCFMKYNYLTRMMILSNKLKTTTTTTKSLPDSKEWPVTLFLSLMLTTLGICQHASANAYAEFANAPSGQWFQLKRLKKPHLLSNLLGVYFYDGGNVFSRRS